MKVNKGMEIELRIEEVLFPNIGIGKVGNKEVRIKGGLLGEKLLVRISRRKKDHFLGKIIEVLEPSYLEEIDGCPHFRVCGGCTYQNMSYDRELEYKKEQVENLFKRYNLDVKIKDIEGSPLVTGYRNNMEYTFGDEYKGGPLTLGMHKIGKFYEIETVEHCNIADKDFNTILLNTLEYFKKRDAKFYHRKTHKGFLRNLSVRKSFKKGEILVNLVTSSQDELDEESFLEMLNSLKLEGEIVGVLHTLNDNVADVIKVDKIKLLQGKDFITEELNGLKFKISPFSFFQTNTLAAEKLYENVKNIIGEGKVNTIFDLYSGTGTIAQLVSPLADKVVAIELVEEAVEMARENAKLNKITNIEFIQGDMFKVLNKLEERPELIIVDPPRPGLENSLKKILDFKPETFVYVSCNPRTLARDLVEFKKAGYKFGELHLLDQFPRTPHVEGIIKLTRK